MSVVDNPATIHVDDKKKALCFSLVHPGWKQQSDAAPGKVSVRREVAQHQRGRVAVGDDHLRDENGIATHKGFPGARHLYRQPVEHYAHAVEAEWLTFNHRSRAEDAPIERSTADAFIVRLMRPIGRPYERDIHTATALIINVEKGRTGKKPTNWLPPVLYRFKTGYHDEQRRYHSVEKMATLLAVSRAGYYAWRKRHKSSRAESDEVLVERIREIQERVKHRYGSPRMTEALAREGHRVGHNRVARLMREHDVGRRPRKRYRSTTKSDHKRPVAENVVNREFEVAKANRVWSSDITYIATAEGWLYLCVVIDLYSRKVIGWAMERTMEAGLVVTALMMAILRRGRPGGVIFHSDRGSQYASEGLRGVLQRYGLKQSMSRKGNCWDNAPSEAFFATLKNELCGDRAFATRAEAKAELFEYIEVFYNRLRLHSTLGYLTPDEFEEVQARKAS